MIRLHKNEYSGAYPSEEFETLRHYCDAEQLREQLAQHLYILPQWVALEQGATLALERVFDRFDETPIQISADVWPTYFTILHHTQRRGSLLLRLRELYELNNSRSRFEQKSLQDRLLSDIGLLVITSPSNPDGSFVSPEEIEAVCNTKRHLTVLLDIAYHDYAKQPYNVQEMLARHSNLVMIWSFSKTFGLAGARVGAILCSDVELLGSFFLSPLGINSYSELLCLQALEKREFFVEQVQRLRGRRDRFINTVNQEMTSFTAYYSEGNFCLLKPHSMRSEDAQSRLRTRGVAVRHFPSTIWDKYLRVTIGTETEMVYLVHQLEELDGRV
jgi:histidinol-phosphate/aromatic aminotransferase/cobyric acid decarboxylase-like protein